MVRIYLTLVLGGDARQDNQVLEISKADLSVAGFIPNANNSASDLLMAILEKSSNYLNAESQISNPDIQVTIELLTEQPIVNRNGANYKQKTYIINLTRIAQPVDPDLY